MASEVASAYVSLLPSAKGFRAATQKAVGKDVSGVGVVSGKKLGTGMRVGMLAGLSRIAAPIAALVAGTKIAGFLGGAVSSASDLNETVNKSNAIFGASAGTINRWAEGSVKSVGLSKVAALDTAASFGNMFTQIGFGAKEAANLSIGVTTLSADLGSFNNLPTADVADRIQAAFRGEYDSLQALIPNINAARVAQVAMAATGKTTADALTAQEKAAAVLSIVQQDGAKASGDWAKTSGDLAGQQKQLGANFDNLKTKIGQALLPVFEGFVTFLNDSVLPAISSLGPVFTKIGEFLSPITTAVGDFIDTLTGAGEGATGFGLKFEELKTKFQPFIDSLTPLGEALGGLFDTFLESYESLAPVISEFVDKFTSVLAPALADISALVTETLIPAFEDFMVAVRPIVEFLVEKIGGVVVRAFQVLAIVVKAFIGVLAGVVEFVTGVLTGDWEKAWNGIKRIFSSVWDGIKAYVALAWGWIKTKFSEGMDKAKALVRAGWEWIKTKFSEGIARVKAFVAGIPPYLRQKFSDAMNRAKAAVSAGWATVKAKFSEGIARIKAFVSGLPGVLREKFDNAMSRAKAAVDSGWTRLKTFFSDLPSKIKSAIGDLGSALFQKGKDVIQGLINGVKSMAGSIGSAIANIMPAPIKKLTGFLGISSPSKMFHGFGVNIGEGLVLGVESQQRAVETAVSKLAVTARAGAATLASGDLALGSANSAARDVTIVQHYPPPLPDRAIRNAVGDALALAGRF